MIAVDTNVLAALVRSYLGGRVEIPDSPIESIECALPVGLGRVSPEALTVRLESGVTEPAISPAVTAESGGFPSPVDVEFAIDTVRSLSESSVSPAESVDVDRVLRILFAVRC